MKIFAVFKHAVMITVFVFVMMLLIDFVDTASKRRISALMKGGLWRQYTLTSFLGSTPGCLGAFMNVSLYIHGIISFGAIVGGMIATSGDEAFVMLAQFPVTALTLFILLFVLGIIFAWISDRISHIMRIIPIKPCLENHCEHCLSNSAEQDNVAEFRPANIFLSFKSLSFSRFLLVLLITSFLLLVLFGILGPSSWNWKRITFICLSLCSLYIAIVSSEHYLHSHIWDHIIKKHLLRVFLWSFVALLFVKLGLSFWNLDTFIQEHIAWVLLIAALMGVIPESGPHLVFVMMYSQGLLPFSILFTSSFVQDGHGMLPLLSYSMKDFMLIKFLNFAFGVGTGGIFYALGL